MSQRNPMNERYTTELKSGGHSRKSASSAKPKSSAASSVVIGSKKKKGPKTKAEKREKKREERNRQYEAEQRYGDPPTKKFKIYKRLWIGFLIGSVVTVVMSFAITKFEGAPDWLPIGFLIAAYACIIITLYLDLGKIRRLRREYIAQMMSNQTKEGRAAEKKRKAEQRKEKKIMEENKAKQNSSDITNDKENMSFADKVKSFFKFN